FERVEPPVEDPAQRAVLDVRRREPLDEPPVHRLEPVERRLGLGDLDLGGSESHPLGTLLEPAREEGLAAPVLAAHRLEDGGAAFDATQLFVERGLEAIEPDRERVEAALRNRTAAQRIDDLVASLSGDQARLTTRTDGRAARGSIRWYRSSHRSRSRRS